MLLEFAEELIPYDWQNSAKHRRPMTDAQLCLCLGREATPHTVSSAWWLIVLQLHGLYSPILMAFVDADYKFIWATVCSNEQVILKCSKTVTWRKQSAMECRAYSLTLTER
ncbi:hypothetical protein DPMN_064427 [Dreissena polymorpha]|uniref:Uncharacterized protein n=1 Tax=Dreissena polymorpha TaxID=45954 RepID=A0A9D4CDS7_DREPO|nr:hypothetical protein DPMN_064427 [Dreissena polymorpha]